MRVLVRWLVSSPAPYNPLPPPTSSSQQQHTPTLAKLSRRSAPPQAAQSPCIVSIRAPAGSHGVDRRGRGGGGGRGGVHVRDAAGVGVHPAHDAEERAGAGPAGGAAGGGAVRQAAGARGGVGAAARGAHQPRRGGHGGPHAPPPRLLRRRQVPDGGQGRQVRAPVLRGPRRQVAHPQRGRRLHGRARAHEPGQGPHGELVLPQGRGARRRHPVQQGVRHDGVRVPRHGPALQPGVQRGHEEPLGHHHQEAPRVLHGLRGRLHARRRGRRHRRHRARRHLPPLTHPGHQLRPAPRDLRGAAVPRRAARRRGHVQVGAGRRRHPHEVDPPRLERRALRHAAQELLRRAAGERQGDRRRVRAAGEHRGRPQGAGRVPHRHDHARA